MFSFSGLSEIGQDFADDGAKLESVTGESGREEDVCVMGMAVDDKVLIGRHRVKTDGMPSNLCRYLRQTTRQKGLQALWITRQ